MTLFFSLLPFYLFGNLHCIGMCGPLVMMIGAHQSRYWYFLGRTLSFSLAGFLAGAAGSVLNQTLQHYQLSAVTSFLFGGIFLALGICGLWGYRIPVNQWLARQLGGISKTLSLLMLRDQAWPAFLFGFFTVALPCGQTAIVFAACALYGDPGVGALNGMAFALLTSPALFMAMQARRLFPFGHRHYDKIMAGCALFIGTLTLCRGLAEVGVIPHLVLNEAYHIVIY